MDANSRPGEAPSADSPAASSPPPVDVDEPGNATPEELARLAELFEVADEAETVLIVTHDNPDPDSIASAAALGFLLESESKAKVRYAFGGIVGRAENRALIEELGITFERLGEGTEIPRQTTVALVDTQPRAGNNSLPPGQIASVVIDHHPLRAETAATLFADVRPEYGAACTILVEYLRTAGLEPDQKLATALFYGIQSETADLGRDVSEADIEASVYLYPRADPAANARIRHPQLPVSYFRSVHEALEQARQHGSAVLVTVGRLAYPDMVAELADLLNRGKGLEWAVAMGRYKDRMLISVRTVKRQAHAGELVREVVGERGSAGGHGMLAGAQISLQGLSEPEIQELSDSLQQDFLAALGVEKEPAVPLIGRDTQAEASR